MIQFGLVQFSTVPDASVNEVLEYVRFTTLDNTCINFNCYNFTFYHLQDAPLYWITFAVPTSGSASDGTYHDSQ